MTHYRTLCASLPAVVAAVTLAMLGSTALGEVIRPRADGMVDDFEGDLLWQKRTDGGHAPKIELSHDRVHTGKGSLRIEYVNQAPEWGSLQREIALTGEEIALSFWLYVETAQPKAAMHIWLFEKDGDAWVRRVTVGDQDALADLAGQWVEVRMPLSEFRFDPRGRGTPELSRVNAIVINCNFADFTAYVDDLRFEVPPELQERLQAEEQRRTQLREETMRRIGWRPSEKGNVAVFKDDVPAAEDGIFSDPDYLAELLVKAGYLVSFLTGRDLSLPELLRPELFDLVVLPYGPRFPSEAAEAFRAYLQNGGRFLSMGGYAFDEPYFLDQGPEVTEMLGVGGFEQPGEGEMPLGWFHTLGEMPGLVMRRDTKVKCTGEASLYIAAPDNLPVTWFIARCRIDKPNPSLRYLLTSKVLVRNIHNGLGAYMGVDFYRANGERISFVQTGMVKQTDTWESLSLAFGIPPGTDHMTVNAILYSHGEAWFDDFELRPEPTSINARHATPKDMLHISEDQIPVFDPSFRLRRVKEVRAAEGQQVVPASVKIAEPVEGYAAVALWGQNTAVNPQPYSRWIPLLRTYDEYGHLQGTVGAALFHHAGPWKGSAWAFFGATNRDLFRRGDAQGSRVLLGTVEHLLRGAYLSLPEPTRMCYRDGEQIGASVLVANAGETPTRLQVTVEVRETGGKHVGEALSKPVVLDPGAQQIVEFQWPELKLARDLYEIRFYLTEGKQAVDEVSTGFVIWRKDVVAKGPDVHWENNCFRIGDKPAHLLVGTNQTGVVLGPWWENPLAWERELKQMRDWGLRVLRVLHISAFAGDLEKPEEKFLRRMDALVYMCQRQGIVLFPCMHDWLGGIALPEEVLQRESRFAQILAERYEDVPGIIIDVENEASVGANDVPELRAMFNHFLRGLYGDDEATLRATWGENAKFGEVPYNWPPNPTGWQDLRWLDFNLFRRRLVERWLKANVEAMRAVNERHPITNEYYLIPGGDAGEANKYCDFVNVHAYGAWPPSQIKYYDHSAEGMGFAVGEFGARSHPSMAGGGWGWSPEPETRRQFLRLPNITLGGTGSLVCSWDWKDMESCIFPWGLVYPCDLTPKGQFYAYRAASHVLSQVRLDYADPRVYVLVADMNELGTRDPQNWQPALRCIDMLLRCGVPFGVLHDTNLTKLPAAARLVFYPCPFTMTDDTHARLEEFVRKGGILYVSGEVSYDERRQRTKTTRLETLCGVRDSGVVYLPDAQPEERTTAQPVAAARQAGLAGFPAVPCVKVTPTTAEVLASLGDGQPVLLLNKLGAGQVFFCTDPFEYHAETTDKGLYAYILSQTGIQQMKVGGENVMVMLPPQGTGGIVVLYHDAAEGETVAEVSSARVRLTARNWGMAAWDDRQQVYALEGVGRVAAGEFECVSDETSPLLIAAQGGSMETTKRYSLVVVPLDKEPYDRLTVKIRRPDLRNLSGAYGEYADGQWRQLGKVAVRQPGRDGYWVLEVPAGLICDLRAE